MDPKPDAPKPDTPKPDTPKPEDPQSADAPSRVPTPEVPTPEVPTPDAAPPVERVEPTRDVTPDATPTQTDEPHDEPQADVKREDAPGDETQPAEVVATETEAATSEAGTSEATTSDTGKADAASPEAGSAETESAEAASAGEATGSAPKKKAAKKQGARKKKKKKARKRPPPRHVEPPLPPELKEEARQAAVTRVVTSSKGSRAGVEFAIEALASGLSIPFLARFRRQQTGGMDERWLRNMRDGLEEILHEEERRTGIRALMKKRGALTDKVAAALDAASTIAAMEDLAAPFLPVSASRATMARGHGLQGLADAIRTATEATPLSELAKQFVPEGSEPTAFDVALGGARDILAEELVLDAGVRARLRKLFLNEGVLRVAARTDNKRREPAREAPAGLTQDAPEEEDKTSPVPKGKKAKAAPAKGSLVGFSARAAKVPPIKMLAIRRAEKQRQVVASIEPPEEKAIAIVHKHAVPEESPHAGFLRAAAEDGYRRILKPMLQNELRLVLKRRADEHAMEQFERALRNLLLGPYAGARRTLGLRPDVMNGHRWCVVDEAGQAAGSGQLPHAPTAGREACVTELTDILKTYEVSAVAVGTTGGRADALSLAAEAAKDIERTIDVTEVPDGGTRALESMGPVEFENHLTVPAECRGAMSLARRFQDPLAELVHVEPKALALGPHLHEVHQGHLRRMLDESVESCVAHVGVDPNTADLELLARVPGFNRRTAQAFLVYREGAGPLKSKAELAAIDDVGPKVAEQAVGFLKLRDAEDARDRTQLHPEQYAVAEKMAAQVDADVETLFSNPDAQKKVRLDALVDEETSMPRLKHVLYEATAGQEDPRPKFKHFIPPPPGVKLGDLANQQNLMLQGRVIRAAPFGVFLDVGLGVEALIPMPHIGEHAGLEPSTVAPVGAVIAARVMEVDEAKKRLTLTMRRSVPPRGGRGPGGRPPRGGDRGPRPARGGQRAGSDRPSGDRRPVGAGAGGGARSSGGPRTGGGQSSGGGPRTGGGGPRSSGGGPRTGGGQRTPGGRFASQGGARGRQGGQRKPGRFDGGKGGFGGGRGGRQDRNTPRSISLEPEDKDKGLSKAEEAKLTPEELLAYKLEQMKRKLERPDA